MVEAIIRDGRVYHLEMHGKQRDGNVRLVEVSVESIELDGVPCLLLNARATADDGSKLTVSFPAGSTFAIKMLGRADTQSVVLPTVCAVFGRRTVDYVLDGGGTPAPQHEEHSPSARAAVSADPQPVSSVPPASSSASATQPKAAPVAAPTPSAPEPAAPKPAAPIPAPKSAAAPAPKSSDLAKAPWLRSDNPAGAPATGKLPTEPAPRAPERASARWRDTRNPLRHCAGLLP